MPLRLFYNWYRNTLRNPRYRVWIILGTLFYLLNPLDILPEFALPILGEIDDIALLTLLVTEVVQLVKDRKQSGNNEVDINNPSSVPPDNTSETVDVKATAINSPPSQ